MATRERPISPHLQIYRPQLTSVLSILHRITGVLLSVGTLMLAYWLAAAAAGPEAYEHAQGVIGSMLGQLFLFFWTWSLFHHLAGGIRHLIWDAGYGIDIVTVYRTANYVIWPPVILTFLCWFIAA